jgi:hypothetical protein
VGVGLVLLTLMRERADVGAMWKDASGGTEEDRAA